MGLGPGTKILKLKKFFFFTYVSIHFWILVKIRFIVLTNMQISAVIRIYMLAANFYQDLPMLASYRHHLKPVEKSFLYFWQESLSSL